MTKPSYSASVRASISPAEAFKRISRVPDWWTKNVTGEAAKLADKFTVRFGDTFVDFEVVEQRPNHGAVWEVTDCNLHWIEDKKEWRGSRIVWEISRPEQESTTVRMTHLGLVPGIECYDSCVKGWNFYIEESLRSLLTENRGFPDGER